MNPPKRNKDGYYKHNEWYVLDIRPSTWQATCFPDTKETKLTISVKLKDLRRALKDAEKRNKKGLLGFIHLSPNISLFFTDAKVFKRSKKRK